VVDVAALQRENVELRGQVAQLVEQLAKRSPGIKRFWGWGTSEMTGLRQRER